MLTYEKATKLFSAARNPGAGRPLANNTRLFKQDGSFAVRFHNTDILTVQKTGAYILNSGGWRTVTTKARLNEYGPVNISQMRGQWYVRPHSANWNDPAQVFADGMRVTAKGRIIGAAGTREEKAATKLRKDIAAYAKEYTRKLYAGELPAPSGGDCWGCCMRTAEGDNPMGHGGDHIREHVKEKYYVPSLLLLALDKMGASIAAKHDAAYRLKLPGWENTSTFGNGDTRDFIRQQITRTLRRYCLQQVGLTY